MITSLSRKTALAVLMTSALPLMPVVAVDQAAAPPAAPAAPAPVDASHSTLRVIVAEAPNATQWALAPLGQSPPPGIRQNLTMLREDIADEAKAGPIGTVAAYQAAYRLCSELIAALDERTLAQVRAGYRTAQIENVPLVTSQALEARRNYRMSWPQYAREQDQRSAIEHAAETDGNVAKEGLKVQWAERTATLRPLFDQLYADLRAGLRETPALLEPTRFAPSATAGNSALPANPIPVVPSTPNPPPSSPPAESTTAKTPPERSRGHHAEIKDLQPIMLLNRKINAVFAGADLVNEIKFGDIGLPDDKKAYGYFKLFVLIDNAQCDIPPGAFTAHTRILCADPQGNLSVAETSDVIELPNRGRHLVVLCNTPGNDDIKARNGGDKHPRNAYVEFMINNKVFRQVLLSSFGPDGWWTMDKLVPERF
jgi:hypothetical protein